MRITDFELQTQSGQLWIDIQERLAAKDLEIASLNAQLSGSTPQPAQDPQSSLVEQLHAAFVGTLTEPQQVAYAAPYAIVRTLVSSDNLKLAADYMLTVPTPDDLIPARDGLIALINSFLP